MGAIVLASLAALGYGLLINWSQLTSYDWHIVYWPLLVGLSLYPVALGIAVATWRGILRHLGARSSWQQDLRIYCVSNLARRLPTPVWFVAGRIYLYNEIQVAKSTSSLATVIETVLILFSGLLMCLISVPLGTGVSFIDRHGAKLLPVVLLSLIVILRPQFLRGCFDWLARRLGQQRTIAAAVDYRHMLLWTALYSLVWIIGGVMLYMLARTVYPLQVRHLPTVVAAWAIAGVVSHLAVLTPGGLGVKELTLTALLAGLMPTPIAIIVAIAARVWYSLNELLWFAASSYLYRRERGADPSLG